MLKMQYQGLSMLDRIETVEVGYDEKQQFVHLYDPHAVVWPEYNGRSYVESEGFQTMKKVLQQKPMFQFQDPMQFSRFKWVFYRPERPVVILKNGEFEMVQELDITTLEKGFIDKIR